MRAVSERAEGLGASFQQRLAFLWGAIPHLQCGLVPAGAAGLRPNRPVPSSAMRAMAQDVTVM